MVEENIQSVQKSITILQDESDFIKDKCINLSRFVQKKIREEMNGK